MENKTETIYTDKRGKAICIGDYVELDGLIFEVIINPFNSHIIIDGDNGAADLEEVHETCTIIRRFHTIEDIFQEITRLRQNFIFKHDISPNTVYLGTALYYILMQGKASLPYFVEAAFLAPMKIWGMEVVEVAGRKDPHHISVGLTME